MLHAVIKKKSHYLLKKQNNIRKIPREDIITSTIFGPLRYFEDQDIYYFIRSIAGIENNLDDNNKLQVEANIYFWPSKIATFNNELRSCEPDIVFNFDGNDINETYIFELKWGAYSFSEDQIEREWQFFKSTEEDATSYLIYLANYVDTFNAIKASKNKNWKSLTWLNFLHKIKEIKHQSNNQKLQHYLDDLINFLGCLDFREFDSFSHLKLNIDPDLKINYHFRNIGDDLISFWDCLDLRTFNAFTNLNLNIDPDLKINYHFRNIGTDVSSSNI
ncbi:hypothetical protein GASC598I20_006530 [Gilliamella apicola SCGC AB-598-I20]|nr:hypothetical protein GASC598I20_006530 [Gilliamella apicola SCGC AB-598-I20]